MVKVSTLPVAGQMLYKPKLQGSRLKLDRRPQAKGALHSDPIPQLSPHPTPPHLTPDSQTEQQTGLHELL